MVLSRRERYIAIVTIALVASVMLYRYLLAPLLTQATELSGQIADAQVKMKRTQGVFDNSVLVRISDLLITSTRKEGSDDLTLSLGISTIYYAPEADRSRSATASAAWEVSP